MTRSTLTLDQAQERFRYEPDLPGAKLYQQTALEYAYDYMISSEEFVAISLEIRSWLQLRK